MVLLGLPALSLAINSSIPTYAGNVTGRRGNVNISFLPDLLKIINEKKSTPKKVVLFGPLPGICLTELL